MNSEYDHLAKILMVGESGVGKTCIIRRYTKNEFSLSHLSTIAIDFKMYVQMVEDVKLKFQIWDTAGQERFNTLTAGFFKGSDGIIVTYSITDRQSFNSVNKWMSQIKSLAPPEVVIFLVGNKKDQENKREVTFDEGKQIADKYSCSFKESSAKTGDNIIPIFEKMGKEVYEVLKLNPKIDYDDTTLGQFTQKRKCCSK